MANLPHDTIVAHARRCVQRSLETTIGRILHVGKNHKTIGINASPVVSRGGEVDPVKFLQLLYINETIDGGKCASTVHATPQQRQRGESTKHCLFIR